MVQLAQRHSLIISHACTMQWRIAATSSSNASRVSPLCMPVLGPITLMTGRLASSLHWVEALVPAEKSTGVHLISTFAQPPSATSCPPKQTVLRCVIVIIRSALDSARKARSSRRTVMALMAWSLTPPCTWPAKRFGKVRASWRRSEWSSLWRGRG